MITMTKRTGFALFAIMILVAFSSRAQAQVQAGVDPSSVTMKLYSISIYANEDCSGTPVTIDFGSGGTLKDFVSDPTLGFTQIANGTYNCLVFKMSDTISFVPASNFESLCTAGNTYSIEVCGDGMTTMDPSTGAVTACSSGVDDTVFLYISTWSTAIGDNPDNEAFLPPVAAGDADHGILLSSAMTVSGGTTGEFIFGANGKVAEDQNNPGHCGMNQPSFGFATVPFEEPPAGSCVSDADCATWSLNVLMGSNAINPIYAIVIRNPVCVSFLAGNYCTIPCHPSSRGIDLVGVCGAIDQGYYFSENGYMTLKPEGAAVNIQCTTDAGDTSCSTGLSTCYCLDPTWLH